MLNFVLAALITVAQADAPPATGEPAAAVVPPAADAPLLASYEAVSHALFLDNAGATVVLARALAAGTRDSSPSVSAAADAVAAVDNLADQRVAFAELSRQVVLVLDVAPPPGVKTFRCPMVDGYAFWVQPDAGVRNPYMGQKMAHCGEGTSLHAAAKAAATR